MRIAQVCPRYYPYFGGVEQHVRNISKGLARKHDVSVLTTDPSQKLPSEEIVNGVKIKRFSSWAPNEAYYLSGQLKKCLMKNSENFDIVHAHNYHAFPASYAARAKTSNSLVFTPHYHGTGHTFFRNLLHIPYKFFGKKIFEKSDKIVCVSNYEKDLVMTRFKVDEEKIIVIPNGIDLEECNGLERRKKNYRSILYVGRLEKYKGAQYIVEALSRTPDDIILEIVGKGPHKKSLVKLVAKLGLKNRVRFYQDLPRQKLLQKYIDADLFVLLSKNEAYGISIAEALASRTPCIVANSSASMEWVDNNNCFGINYPPDIDLLVRLIDQAIETEVDNVKLPNWKDAVSKLVELYEKF